MPSILLAVLSARYCICLPIATSVIQVCYILLYIARLHCRSSAVLICHNCGGVVGHHMKLVDRMEWRMPVLGIIVA